MNRLRAVRLANWLIHLPRFTVSILFSLYHVTLSPLMAAWFGPACRFTPTCSEYARDAIQTHGVIAGGWMALRRLGRCRPAGGFGYDPAPPKRPAGA